MFRNREFKYLFLMCLALTFTFTFLGLALSTLTGVLVLNIAVFLDGIFLLFAKHQYSKIKRITDQVDMVLHDEDHLYFSQTIEGELSILESEIMKMTLRIREQNKALKKEKVNLADSLANIAHQLRAPLTSLSLILSLLEDNPDENERKRYAHEAEDMLVRMDWLVTALLKMSRLDAGVVTFQCEEAKAEDVVRAAIQPLQIPLELHCIDLQIHIPKGITFQCDPGWLAEALQNILKNCLENLDDKGEIEVACALNTLYKEIIIRDNGRGFEEEDLPHIFDRFYRGHSTTAAGYGIGLALSKMIITRHGGTIKAINHPQGGAEFSIRFPQVTDL